jgi:hypothetical protein
MIPSSFSGAGRRLSVSALPSILAAQSADARAALLAEFTRALVLQTVVSLQ